MKTLPSDLAQFTGTEAYHKVTIIPGLVATDGVTYLAKSVGAFWLIDEIAAMALKFRKTESFMVAKLVVAEGDNGAVIDLEDGNGNVLANKQIEFTDFPAPGIELVLEDAGDFHVLMLWSER